MGGGQRAGTSRGSLEAQIAPGTECTKLQEVNSRCQGSRPRTIQHPPLSSQQTHNGESCCSPGRSTLCTVVRRWVTRTAGELPAASGLLTPSLLRTVGILFLFIHHLFSLSAYRTWQLHSMLLSLMDDKQGAVLHKIQR